MCNKAEVMKDFKLFSFSGYARLEAMSHSLSLQYERTLSGHKEPFGGNITVFVAIEVHFAWISVTVNSGWILFQSQIFADFV